MSEQGLWAYFAIMYERVHGLGTGPGRDRGRKSRFQRSAERAARRASESCRTG